MKHSNLTSCAKFTTKKSQENGVRKSNEARRNFKERPNNILTSNKSYEADEVEFMKAMYEYSLKTGHKFPAHSEYLHVLVNVLGYTRPIREGERAVLATGS